MTPEPPAVLSPLWSDLQSPSSSLSKTRFSRRSSSKKSGTSTARPSVDSTLSDPSADRPPKLISALQRFNLFGRRTYSRVDDPQSSTPSVSSPQQPQPCSSRQIEQFSIEEPPQSAPPTSFFKRFARFGSGSKERTPSSPLSKQSEATVPEQAGLHEESSCTLIPARPSRVSRVYSFFSRKGRQDPPPAPV